MPLRRIDNNAREVEYLAVNERGQRAGMVWGDSGRGVWHPKLEIEFPLQAPGRDPGRGEGLRTLSVEWADMARLGAIQGRSVNEQTGRITITGTNRVLDLFVRRDDAAEFQLTLATPPQAGRPFELPFNVNLPSGITAVYQPPLVDPQIVGDIVMGTHNGLAASRHLRIDGGYVIRGPWQNDRLAGGGQTARYAGTGKLGEFRRLCATDAAGAKLWSTLTFNAGELSHEWDVNWMRHVDRVYPIVIGSGENATFGYTSIGGSNGTAWTLGTRYALGEAGTVTAMSAYIRPPVGNPNIKGIIYSSTGAPYPDARQGYTVSIATAFGASDWYSGAMDGGDPALSAASFYILFDNDQASYNMWNYDAGSNNCKYTTSDLFVFATPDDPAPGTMSDAGNLDISMYATYTAGGGGGSILPLVVADMANISDMGGMRG